MRSAARRVSAMKIDDRCRKGRLKAVLLSSLVFGVAHADTIDRDEVAAAMALADDHEHG